MSKRNVLILEMDPQVAGAYELFLSARGFTVSSASTLAAAVRALSAAPAEVALIGNLPDDIDAEEAVARLRVMVAPRPLGVIAMSPSMDEIPGVDLIIPRGAHPRALVDAIRTTLRRRPVTAPYATAS
jgi:DNA-binding response OmpR family regulator